MIDTYRVGDIVEVSNLVNKVFHGIDGHRKCTIAEILPDTGDEPRLVVEFEYDDGREKVRHVLFPDEITVKE